MHFESVFSCLCPHLSFLTAGFFRGPAGPHLLLYSLPSGLRYPVFAAWAAGHWLGSDPLLMPHDSHRSFRTPSRGGRCLGPLCFQHALYPFLPETSLSPGPCRLSAGIGGRLGTLRPELPPGGAPARGPQAMQPMGASGPMGVTQSWSRGLP